MCFTAPAWNKSNHTKKNASIQAPGVLSLINHPRMHLDYVHFLPISTWSVLSSHLVCLSLLQLVNDTSLKHWLFIIFFFFFLLVVYVTRHFARMEKFFFFVCVRQEVGWGLFDIYITLFFYITPAA